MHKFYLLLACFVFLFSACIINDFHPSYTNSVGQSVGDQEASMVKKQKPETAVVPILIYHHIREIKESDSNTEQTFVVTPESFAAQMAYLQRQGFTSISFGNLVDYFDGNFDLPAKPVIVSFDDGVIDQYQNAWPVLQQHNLVATFFIFPNPISKSNNYMNWEQLQELVNSGMEIGSHGWYHLYFDRIGQEALEKEIVQSKKVLEEKLGIKVRILAYPFGQYNESVQQAVKAAGYEAARDIVNGKQHTPDNLFSLKGYFVTNDFSRFVSILK